MVAWGAIAKGAIKIAPTIFGFVGKLFGKGKKKKAEAAKLAEQEAMAQQTVTEKPESPNPSNPLGNLLATAVVGLVTSAIENNAPIAPSTNPFGDIAATTPLPKTPLASMASTYLGGGGGMSV